MGDNWIPFDILGVINTFLAATERGRLILSVNHFYSTLRSNQAFWNAVWLESAFYIRENEASAPDNSPASIRRKLKAGWTAFRRLRQPQSLSSLRFTLLFGIPGWLEADPYYYHDVSSNLVSKQGAFFATSSVEYSVGSFSDHATFESIFIDANEVRAQGDINALPFCTRPKHPAAFAAAYALGKGFFCIDTTYDTQQNNKIYTMPKEKGAELVLHRQLSASHFPPHRPGCNTTNTPRIIYHSVGERPLFVALSVIGTSKDGSVDTNLFISVYDILADQATLESAVLGLPPYIDRPQLLKEASRIASIFPQVGDSHLIIHFSFESKIYIIVWDLSPSATPQAPGSPLPPKYVLTTQASFRNKNILFDGGFLTFDNDAESNLTVFDLRNVRPFSNHPENVESRSFHTSCQTTRGSSCGRYHARSGSWNTPYSPITDLTSGETLFSLPRCTNVSFIDSSQMLVSDYSSVLHVNLLEPLQEHECPTLQVGILSGNLSHHKHSKAERDIAIVTISSYQLELKICQLLRVDDYEEVSLIWVSIESEDYAMFKVKSSDHARFAVPDTRRFGHRDALCMFVASGNGGLVTDLTRKPALPRGQRADLTPYAHSVSAIHLPDSKGDVRVNQRYGKFPDKVEPVQRFKSLADVNFQAGFVLFLLRKDFLFSVRDVDMRMADGKLDYLLVPSTL